MHGFLDENRGNILATFGTSPGACVVMTHSPESRHRRPAHRSWAEPWKVKVVEPIKMMTRAERTRAIAEAGYNTFLLRSEDVYIDLLTDSGTSAMSDWQWAGMMLGDEAYAGSRNFYNLEAAIQKHYGYRYIVPTHQGRGAENLLSRILIKPGDYVPGNMYFTTTRLHQELAGGTFVDVIVPEAHDPNDESPFKGNVDLDALEALVQRVGADRIPYVCIAGTVNMAGGQPMSMANTRAVRELTARHGIRVMLDATRAVENAYFIQQREVGYRDKPVAEILLALNDPHLYEEASNLVVVYEGLHTYGGMAGRDMEAMARGIVESVDDEHIQARVGQVEYLGHKLIDMGVPVVRPIGGHAATGKHHYPALELVRLTIPRRVYTQAHMDIVAESAAAVFDERDTARGLRMAHEPRYLRFFQARFEPLAGGPA